jgi:hypothetical protein
MRRIDTAQLRAEALRCEEKGEKSVACKVKHDSRQTTYVCAPKESSDVQFVFAPPARMCRAMNVPSTSASHG